MANSRLWMVAPGGFSLSRRGRETCELTLLSLRPQERGWRGVNPAAQFELPREPVHKGPETDVLHSILHDDLHALNLAAASCPILELRRRETRWSQGLEREGS
jgi:hypothetical protein